jgi:hypothetical protein
VKYCLITFAMIAFLAMGGCTDSDTVKDPEALYQQYLKDDVARQAKVKECKLLSVDKQTKSQPCTIALKADGDKEMKKHGGVKMGPLDLSK